MPWVGDPFLPSLPPKAHLTELHPPLSKRRLRFGLCLFQGNLLVQELFDDHLGVVDLVSFALGDERDAQMLLLVVVHQCVLAVCSEVTILLGTVHEIWQVLADMAFELLFSAWVPSRFAVREGT